MGYNSKKFEDLTLRDDFIFGNVMKNKALSDCSPHFHKWEVL